MNRLVLIGNGFDLAHGLPTKYEHFINWYWDQRVSSFLENRKFHSKDPLCSFHDTPFRMYYKVATQLPFPSKQLDDGINHPRKRKRKKTKLNKSNFNFTISASPFFEHICQSIETKGWVDIENEYYCLLIGCTIENKSEISLDDLNTQFNFLSEKLIEYLNVINSINAKKLDGIWNIIYSSIKLEDVSNEGRHFVDEYLKDWMNKNESVLCEKINQYGLDLDKTLRRVMSNKTCFNSPNYSDKDSAIPELFLLPDHVMLLSFNYTNVTDLYQRDDISKTIHMHGELKNPNSIIFGYGDELDEKYKQLQALNENECLKNIKSIKYLESDHYRNVLRFLESEPFQVLIMGHSCGNSDRTLLNTIFEHKNCISIKPYYHIKDDGTDSYLDIVQNISRNFTDMKLMRDRVVNKTFCEPLPQAKVNQEDSEDNAS